jgi:hypothetical protein
VASKRNYKQEYARYQSQPIQIKRRAERNAARRKLMKEGKVSKGDGKDVNHIVASAKGKLKNNESNLNVQSAHKNRSYPRTKNAGKKYKTHR